MAYKIGSSPRGITWSSHRRKRRKKTIPFCEKCDKERHNGKRRGNMVYKIKIKNKAKIEKEYLDNPQDKRKARAYVQVLENELSPSYKKQLHKFAKDWGKIGFKTKIVKKKNYVALYIKPKPKL